MNKARNLPSICLFRQRFLYVFGGESHNTVEFSSKSVSQIERLDVREGVEWEIIKIKKSEFKIRAHSVGSL